MTVLSPAAMPTPAAAAPEAAALKAKAVRGFKVASFATVGKVGVDFGAQLLLARVLAPEHFGLFFFAQALGGFVSCFTDLAGQKYLIRQREAPTLREISTVFWFELLLATAIAALWFVLCGPALVQLEKPEAIVMARVLAVWIVAERLLLPKALLDRALKFERSNAALFLGVVAGCACAIVGALAGLGAWSLVAGLLGRTLATGALLWTATGFRPRFEFQLPTAKSLLAFGAPLAGTTALTFAYTNVDYLIVGGVAGLTAVGFYSAAYRYPHYLNQFNVILTSVVFPSFSKTRDDAHLARGLRLLTRYAGVLAMAPVVAMWAEGETLLRWLLGERWLPALFPFQCFTTLAAARLALVHWGQVYVVKGQTRALFVMSCVNLPLIAAATWLGVRWGGIEGAALGVTVCSLATLFFCCAVLLPRALPGFRYLESLFPALLAGLASISLALLLQAITPGGDVWALVRVLAGGAAYAGVLWGLCSAEFRALLRSR